ncbi:protein tyrosine phosphatase [Stigmatella sp. ncwal1]|uniref:Protein tyrosine phosphatase n=1 Tax=Stigmatella ashevillensis TaxID=2995309 RepID=A0ABT5DID7_9BACT|nr:protein tyrosine phosphatase [Stigmatella ashevillena]MDC0712854.1 protein tyrosine phosphatase [Stigmatella ashevillena]
MPIPSAAPDASYAQLVLDDEGSQVRRFRSPGTVERSPDFNGKGLAELACSGSAQFSAVGWKALQERLGVPRKRLYVIDLRQESHGFLNGAAISWYAQSNWGCAGLSDEQALRLEALRLELLEHSERIQLGRVEDVKRGTPRLFTEWPRQTVASEERILDLPQGHYIRLPVTDHTRPSDATVERFIGLVRGLPSQVHLHFHCRGGKGRTSTFLALYDMLRHARRLSYDALLERQRRWNDYDLRKTADPASPKAPHIQERTQFLERFYRYAHDNPGGAPTPWPQWLSAQKDSKG